MSTQTKSLYAAIDEFSMAKSSLIPLHISDMVSFEGSNITEVQNKQKTTRVSKWRIEMTKGVPL